MRIYEIKSLHNDNCVLKLEYPEKLDEFTHLNDEQFTNTFEIFARILFDNLMTKDRKEFQIIYSEDKDKWEYYFQTEAKPKDR